MKQIELSVEEHQRRMQAAVSKSELRSREAAEQMVDRTIADAQTALQVTLLLSRFCSVCDKNV